jgi:hypothetical protein
MTKYRNKALCTRFISNTVDKLNYVIAQQWNKMDQILDILHIFGVADVSNYNQVNDNNDYQLRDEFRNTLGWKLGQEYYFQTNMLTKIGDFILGRKSPLYT